LHRALKDLEALTEEALQEIRTTSYLLHPPTLDEAGFSSAARWFVEGFTKRSGIPVGCEIPDDGERLPDAVELVLFRVLQESLTNVHRHSEATAATVKFVVGDHHVELQVSDNGHGVSPEHVKSILESGVTGVGIAGMQERVRELGGQFVIRSASTGTNIRVILPRSRASIVANRGRSASAG
jgi:two-component system, NarL family, sensor kinase